MKEKKKKENENFPGYPHYSASEDLMNTNSPVNIDIEDLPNSKVPAVDNKNETPEIIPGTAADVTEDDLRTLGSVNEDQDEGEDETAMAELRRNPDLSGDDLDVPGSELDDASEEIGSEDEENNFYSRGQE